MALLTSLTPLTRSTQPTPPTHGRSPIENLRLSRDALRRADASSRDAASVPVLVERLALLSELLGGLGSVLEATRDELWRRERAGTLSAVDGVFTGEPAVALATMALWADRACADATHARGAVDNAHVATAGLADAVR